MPLVPKNLLDGLERLHQRYARILVTACVLDPDAMDRIPVYRSALQIWPTDLLERPAHITVLGILLELEQFGVVREVREQGDMFDVSVSEKETEVA